MSNTAVYDDAGQVLTNKTIDGDLNTLLNITATDYDYQQKEVGGTYIYWGFDATGTGYRIVRQTVADSSWAESIGTYPTPYADYAAAWTARAALSYT